MANEGTKIKKTNWVARFKLVGKAKINDFTFKIDEQSQRSSWIYNSMNLGVDCGKDYGVVYASMMGGFAPDRENSINANSKSDFSKIEVAWEDRHNENILEELHDMNFINVGLEKSADGKTFPKRFLSEYDAIEYISRHLKDGMEISVGGNIKYSIYNGEVQMSREITSLYLYDGDESGYRATFRQSVLIDCDSASPKDIDKQTGIMPVDVLVLDYVKEINGHEVKGQFPYHTRFEYAFDMSNPELVKTIYGKLFKVKKGYTQITFDGEFKSGGSVVKPTIDDIPDEIRKLIGDVMTEEQVLEYCSDNGSREFHAFLKTPVIRMVGDEDSKKPVLQIFPEQYDEDELDMSWVYADSVNNEEPPFDESESDDDDLDWLNL